MMEDKQMMQHSFFKKIGAFSVNLENPRSSVKSLRYAVESMERPHSSLFIYPEGKIVPFSLDKPLFRPGLGWISNRVPDVDVVPIGIYITTAKSDKPILYLKVGKPVKVDHSLDSETLNDVFENEMSQLLARLQSDAFLNPDIFQTM